MTLCPGRKDGGDHNYSDKTQKCITCGKSNDETQAPVLRNRLASKQTHSQSGNPKTMLQEAQMYLKDLIINDGDKPVPDRATLVYKQKRFVGYLAQREVEMRQLEDTLAQRDMELSILRTQLQSTSETVRGLQDDVRELKDALEDQKWKNKKVKTVVHLPMSAASSLPTYGPTSLLAIRTVDETILRKAFFAKDDGTGLVSQYHCSEICGDCGISTTLGKVEGVCENYKLGPKLTVEEVHLVAMKLLNPA
eukprot:PhF_6_TR22715/c0_g1_i1/m.32360